MTQEDFIPFVDELLAEVRRVLIDKGADYARPDNATHNFETAAEWAGLTREKTLSVYMYKHDAALYRYLRDGKVDSEPIRGRIVDGMAYRVFAAAMAHEAESGAGRDFDIYEYMDRVKRPAYDLGAGRGIFDVDNAYTSAKLVTKDGKRTYTSEIHEEDE